MSIVYKITNKRSKKPYFGSSSFSTIEERYGNCNWTRHHNYELRLDALRGDKFEIVILSHYDTYYEALRIEQIILNHFIKSDLWETIYNKNKSVFKIAFHNSDHPMLGKKHSLETRKRMSIAATDRVISSKTREKISEIQKIVQNRPEVKKKISQKNSGMNNGMYKRSVYSVWLDKFGKEKADEREKAYRNKRKGQTRSEMSKLKMGASKIGENNPNTSLREDGVITIRNLWKSHPSLFQTKPKRVGTQRLAEMYNVTPNTIYRIVTNTTWKHLLATEDDFHET